MRSLPICASIAFKMSQISVKRSFGIMQDSPLFQVHPAQCSPHRIQFLSSPNELLPPAKRHQPTPLQIQGVKRRLTTSPPSEVPQNVGPNDDDAKLPSMKKSRLEQALPKKERQQYSAVRSVLLGAYLSIFACACRSHVHSCSVAIQLTLAV